MPNNVTNIGGFAFGSCTNLTSITIPNSTISIGYYAFESCTNLTSITIPNSTKSIDHYAFQNCTNLHLITNLNPVPVDIFEDVFNGVVQSECTLKVPMGSVSAYKEANVWKEFNIVGINVGVGELQITNYELRVYPNPTTGELTIDNGELTIDNVEIFDIYGNKVSPLISHSSPLISINISHLPAGVYFVKITTKNGVFVEKVVKN